MRLEARIIRILHAKDYEYCHTYRRLSSTLFFEIRCSSYCSFTVILSYPIYKTPTMSVTMDQNRDLDARTSSRTNECLHVCGVSDVMPTHALALQERSGVLIRSV